MFLVHGIRRKELTRHLLPGQCPICGEKNCVELVVVQRYAHFFWLPLFPLPKRGSTICATCGYEVAHRKLAMGLKQLFNDLRKQERTPLWMFSGSAILVVALPLFVQAMMRHDQEQDGLLTGPMVGDVWTIKLGYKRYTLCKVESVDADSVHVRANTHELEDAGVVALAKFQLETTDGFIGDRIGYARKELLDLAAHGPIHSVERKRAIESTR